MKFSILAVLIIFSIPALSQITRSETINWIKLGEVKNGQNITEILFSVSGADTTYLLGFNNQQYRQIIQREAVEFKNTGSTLDSLYSFFSGAIELEKDQSQTIILGDDKMIATAGVIMGAKYIEITVPGKSASFTLTKKQLDKLFNKKRR